MARARLGRGQFGPAHAFRSLGPEVVVRQDANGGPLEIVILTAAHRPEKRAEPEAAEPEREGNENDENGHATGSADVFAARARNAFTVTSSEEPDIESAAISGVTWPRIASGTATAL